MGNVAGWQRSLLSLVLCGHVARAEDTDCFPLDYPFLYEDCCRDFQPKTNLPFMQTQCFNEKYTWKKCCTFQFGPKLRGLPQMCSGAAAVTDEDGAITLTVGKVGSIRLFCSGLQLWASMYYSSRLLTDLQEVLSASRTSWTTGYHSLEALSGRKQLHILDVGCGAGGISVTAAKLGHTFTAVDIDPKALILSKRNMALNGLDVADKAFLQWDMQTQPSGEMLAQGPWDIAFTEVQSLVMMKYNNDPKYDVQGTLLNLLMTLFSLPAKRFIFIGRYRQSQDATDTRIHWVATSIMYSLAVLGRQPHLREKCQDGALSPYNDSTCVRHPTISPKFWLYKHGIAPPTDHSGWVVW
eukprot:TRINITY_DN30146_c0_g1_i3.p1 TRINITY_DN30146_c0_g1~~TRINITY_DN30146_c0_g1_i3.p1  ORF type:complete len:353 (+),score=41.61 TRINITY_DN30146_c0_g1_i3:57-1115(+)